MPKIVKIKTDWIIKAYDCAKEGLSVKEIAELLGIDCRTFKSKKKLMHAVRAGYKIFNTKDEKFNFSDYVSRRLTGRAKILWDNITAVEKTDNGVQKVECMLAVAGELMRQRLFIHAWLCSNFCLSKALRKVNISRSMFNNWCQNPDFLQMVNEIDVMKNDMFEYKLLQLVRRGNVHAILHVNKTRNRDRGYGDKTVFEISGNVQHNVISADILDLLPLEEREKLLEAHRQRKQVTSHQIPVLPDVIKTKEVQTIE